MRRGRTLQAVECWMAERVKELWRVKHLGPPESSWEMCCPEEVKDRRTGMQGWEGGRGSGRHEEEPREHQYMRRQPCTQMFWLREKFGGRYFWIQTLVLSFISLWPNATDTIVFFNDMVGIIIRPSFRFVTRQLWNKLLRYLLGGKPFGEGQ